MVPPPRPRPPSAGATLSAEQARDALQRDAQVAETTTAASPDAQDDQLQHVLDVATDEVGDEGENLLKRGDERK